MTQKSEFQYSVRKLNLPRMRLLDHLALLAGELYSRTVLMYWRTVRKTGTGKNGRNTVFLSQYAMERLCSSPALHAHTSDAIVGNFYASVKSAQQRKKAGEQNARYPYRRRRHFKITWKKSAIRLQGGELKLSNGRNTPPLTLPWNFEKPEWVEVGWKPQGGYELRAVYRSPLPPVQKGKVAAVDLGELRSAVVFDGKEATLYSGRLVRSKSRYRARVLAKLQRKMARTLRNPGRKSRKQQRLLQAKRWVNQHIKQQIRDIQHKQTTHLVSTLHQNGVQTIVIGDLRTIQGAKRNSRAGNQNLHNWTVGQFRFLITYKARRLGMHVHLIGEQYTSQTCPRCAVRHKPRGRTYTCSCGFTGDRDVVGAMNIRSKYLGSFGSPVVGVMGPPMRGVRYQPHLPCHLDTSSRNPLL